MENWEASGEDLSPEEQQLLRFQYENALTLKSAHLGFDMDRFVHENPAGKHLIESAIDQIHNSMVELIFADLESPAARDLQVRARAAKLMIDTVLIALDNGRKAALDIADETVVEDSDG